MNTSIRDILAKLQYCLENGKYEEVETERYELKPSLPNASQSKTAYESINAFLNTNGGILILGIKDINNKTPKKYEFKGYQESNEALLKKAEKVFTTIDGRELDISEYLQYEIVNFLDGRLGLLYVNELPEDKKYAFLNGIAYRRVITGDEKVSQEAIDKHEEYKEELKGRRELLPIKDASIQDISLDKVNDYIYELNRKNQLHNSKPTLESAIPFLIQKMFLLKNTEEVTILGMLVCGSYPSTFLGLRATVRAFLKTASKAADDKGEFSGNILDLMRQGLAFVLKNIQVGVVRDDSGKDVAEYPESLISESINNALAHRDYKINDYVKIVIRPNNHIEISNPGAFKSQLIIQEIDDEIPFRRIIPHSKPTNPNLAQVLSVFAKWEGLGNGMAGLVQATLENKIDIPYYKFNAVDSISLFINKGKLIDESIELMFEIYDGYIQQKLKGNPFTKEMKEAFTYLYKSQYFNQKGYYTILLTSDNNHEDAILQLQKAGLIHRHLKSPKYHDVFVVDKTFMESSYGERMLEIFGNNYQVLTEDLQILLQLIYQYNTFNQKKNITASKASNILWYRKHKSEGNIREYDTYKRKIRSYFNKLTERGFIIRHGDGVHTSYTININYSNLFK
ncbi:MAG: hypothetical protein EAZ55_14465 [Cytophagales bacterium]|nr:MAG: hypothetical protein EAZ55_14465 [Cytophagales bacterium]